jgi:hypothetical protein
MFKESLAHLRLGLVQVTASQVTLTRSTKFQESLYELPLKITDRWMLYGT